MRSRKPANMFAELVRKGIQKTGIHQAEVARRAGVKETTLSRYLSAERAEPSLNKALQIFAALHIDPAEYMREAGIPFEVKLEHLPAILKATMQSQAWPNGVTPQQLRQLVACVEAHPEPEALTEEEVCGILTRLQRDPAVELFWSLDDLSPEEQDRIVRVVRAMLQKNDAQR